MLRCRIQGGKQLLIFLKKMGITPLANLFEKKNEQAKLVALQQSVDKYVPGLKKHIASDSKATSTPLSKSVPKNQSQGRG